MVMSSWQPLLAAAALMRMTMSLIAFMTSFGFSFPYSYLKVRAWNYSCSFFNRIGSSVSRASMLSIGLSSKMINSILIDRNWSSLRFPSRLLNVAVVNLLLPA